MEHFKVIEIKIGYEYGKTSLSLSCLVNTSKWFQKKRLNLIFWFFNWAPNFLNFFFNI